jgi:glycine/D-amino acid oxidase-like deaminating enzyme
LPKKVVVIGNGFAGLSATAFMAKAGWDVTVLDRIRIPNYRKAMIVFRAVLKNQSNLI